MKSEGIDPQSVSVASTGTPYNVESAARIRVPELWQAYADRLTWGRGQCLAILDDGCDLSAPAWQAQLPWGPKVCATWNSVNNTADCSPGPQGYHGTTVGYPSSMNLENVRGIAYNNHVALVCCVSTVHLQQDESASMRDGLRWVLQNRERLNITAVNLSPLDDQRHREPQPTCIDTELRLLREAGVWVSAPCGNHHYTDGISWPACQPDCVAVGATSPEEHAVYLDRFVNTDLLVCAFATSSSNAYAAASAQVLREAIDLAGYPWQDDGATLPDAILAVFQQTGRARQDDATGHVYAELDLLAAVDHVFGA